MSEKYHTTLTIPDEFPPVLKEFSREVLRQQPANIYQFGYDYFSQKANEQERQEKHHQARDRQG